MYMDDNYDLYDDEEFYSEEEELAAERELSENAEWKLIQKNTFTRWCNEHLKSSNKSVSDIAFDLSDGLNLISLVEELAAKKFRHVNRRPNFRSQKLENVTNCLRFLEEEEGIKLVNIDSTDVIDSRLKLILGLIWTLILHYSITMPLWEDEPYYGGSGAKEGPTPKQRLLIWVQNKIPDLPIKNFTTDWNDGRAIGALVDAVGPGLCPDWEDWDPSQAKRNATEAMDLAEKYLDVPQLIKPEEMVNPKIDEQSMMTYLSQFPNAKLRPDAPSGKPKTNASRVKAYGPGLEPHGNVVGKPANFIIETFAAGKGEPLVLVKNPNGQPERCDMVFNNDRNLSYSCQYVPTMEGEYTVMIQYSGQEIPKSPYKVMVEGAAGDPSKVTAAGPGLAEFGLQAGKKTYFEVYTEGAGNGTVEIYILDPHGQRDTTRPRIAKSTETTYYVEYLPKEVGKYVVHICFAGSEIPTSPYPVNVAAPCDPSKAYASGRGIQPRGVRVGDLAPIKVHTENAGEGTVTGTLQGPGREEALRFKPVDANTFETSYVPQAPGVYTINLLYGGGHVAKSPFKVNVGPYKESSIRAYGPGLEGGICNKPADFIVETNGETGALGFAIEGPSQAKIECSDNGDGSADVSYLPTAPGEYAVHVLCDNEDIPKSPFMAQIEPATRDFNPQQVRAFGPGLEKNGNVVNKWTNFTVDTRQAGMAPLKLYCEDVQGRRVDIQCRDNRDGTYSCQYLPKHAVKHTIIISYGGVNIPTSPYRVYVEEPSRPENVKVYGPGIDGPVKTFEPTYFFVDCSEAGPGDVAISLCDERGLDVPVEAADNGEGLFRIDYTPKSVGVYTANILFADQEIPTSPYKINVQPNVDLSKVKVTGLEPQIPVNVPAEFKILNENPVSAKAPVSVNVKSPSGRTVLPMIEETPEGNDVTFIPKEVGPHEVHVAVGGQEIPDSPFHTDSFEPIAEAPIVEAPRVAPRQNAMNAMPEPTGAANVKAYGDGLYRGITTKPAEFTIDTREAGPGSLGLTIEGPIEAKMEARDLGDGTCQVTYYPTEAGDYNINIYYNNDKIPGAPYVAKIEPGYTVDVSGVRAYGPGLQPNGVFMDSTTDFTVDATSVSPDCKGKVRAVISSPSGTKNDSLVTPNGDGTYKVAYAPFEKGPHKVDVTYENLPIPQSPFNVNVTEGCDPNRVKAYGPGLEGGHTNQPQQFTIETKGAGQGSLSLAVEGPSKADVTCKDNHDGTCTVDYLPTKAGDYDVKIKFADRPIPGSPFKVPIEDIVDAGKCRMYGPGLNPDGVRATLPATFTVDTSQAGKAPLEVTYDDAKMRSRPVETRQVQPGVYQCTYYPAEEGTCTLGVKHGGKHIPGSPHQQKILPSFDPSKVVVSGPGVENGCPASIPTAFVVDTSDAGEAELDVAIQAPDGTFLRPNVLDNRDATVTVNYTPEECGVYNVKVKYGGKEIPRSPISVHTRPSGDASKCILIDAKKRVVVNEECVINVDKSRAGPGNVSCKIKAPDGRNAEVEVEDNNNGTVSIYYTPRLAGNYNVNIKFGGVDIPNGDFIVEGDVMRVDRVDHTQASRPPALNMFHPVDFVIPTGPVFNYTSAKVITPTGRTHLPDIVDNGDGSVTIKYQPTETGLHNLHVSYNDKPLEGSPYQFYVDAVDSGVVAAYGPGLSYGVAGEPCSFTIDTKNAGAGGLSLAVEGPSKAEISCQDNHDGTCTVTFVPKVAGEYRASVKINGQHIPGSPYLVKVQPRPGESLESSQFSMGTASEFSLSVREYDVSELTADITTPSGRAEPCSLKKLPNGHLGISFTPHETGTHLVNVYRKGQHIPGSPFKIDVSRNEVGDPSKVRVYGEGLYRGAVNQINEFVVDTRDAGYGGLSLAIEGPSKADIDCKDQPDGTCLVSYRPTQSGTYTITIKFADEHVPGSPFNCKIGGVSARAQEESIISRTQTVVESSRVGSVCEISLKVPGSDPMEMVSSVTAPSGTTELCDIVDQRDDHYSIRFTPREMGVHTVCIKHKGLHVPGSPFQFTVGPILEGGAHRARAAGPGLEQAEVDEANEFNVYTREAGAGKLSVAAEGPSKPTVEFEQETNGAAVVAYRCSEPGDYVLSVKFNDEHIPDSPFRVHVHPSTGDARKVTVQALRQKGLAIGKPVAFTCVYNGAKGHLTARVVSPSGAEDEALIQSLDNENSHWAIRFIPRENGVHQIHLMLDGKHIRGSPYRGIVGEVDPDPGLVTASGCGLTQGITGQDNKFLVKTVGSGASTLSVTIDGPTKAKLQAHEVGDGYEFDWNPSAPGNYYITVKYGGNFHIAGSPFKAVVGGEGKATGYHEHSHCVVETTKKTQSSGPVMPKFTSDATKAISKGLGLNKAFVNRYAQFSVDVSQAGKNLLFVGLVGPPNAPPVDEVVVKHGVRNTFNCQYMVKHRGDYLLLIRYGEENIPGSPFTINVI